MRNFEDYFIENTKTLKNKLGIRDIDLLIQKESEISIEQLALLILSGMEGDFDPLHLKSIHRFLFDQVYDFAREYRDVILCKGKTEFLQPEKIASRLEKVMLNAKNSEVAQNNHFEMAKFLADYYYELILIHPFR